MQLAERFTSKERSIVSNVQVTAAMRGPFAAMATATSSVQLRLPKASYGYLHSKEVAMRWVHGLGFAGFLIGAAACTEPNGSAGTILIQANETVHDEGSFVMATIKNLSSDKLQYSVCSYRIEEHGPNGSWRAAYEDMRPCVDVFEFLDGYATRQVEVELGLPADLPAGSYRIRFPEIGRPGNAGDGFVVATQVGGEFELGQ